ncbi:hypothetical protein DITRI_Ditri16bG0071300 [Diplodiscus trichospermus]
MLSKLKLKTTDLSLTSINRVFPPNIYPHRRSHNLLILLCSFASLSVRLEYGLASPSSSSSEPSASTHYISSVGSLYLQLS